MERCDLIVVIIIIIFIAIWLQYSIDNVVIQQEKTNVMT